MARKKAISFERTPVVPAALAIPEIITVIAPGNGQLPQRCCFTKPSPAERFIAVLGGLLDGKMSIAELNFTKALEAKAPATLRAIASDLESYSDFAANLAGPTLPTTPERFTEWVDHMEGIGRKPATIARKLATLASVHAMLGMQSPASNQLTRDTMKGMRRRRGTAQRQAAGLRLGEAIGDVPVDGFTLMSLLEACGIDLPGLRDGAVLSLGYDAGLRVSELVSVASEHLELQADGSGLLDLPRSKTDQEGHGAIAWVSPETMRRVAAWRDAASIRSGPLFRRIAVTRTKAREGRKMISINELANNAAVDKARMAAIPALQATATFAVGNAALSAAAVGGIIRKRALRAADLGLVDLAGDELVNAIASLSTHSMRVGLTQDLFASGADAGPIAQALRWSSTGTALRYGQRLKPASNAAARLLGKLRA